jgi:branched-chain amino acid transport system substrate-binding protein
MAQLAQSGVRKSVSRATLMENVTMSTVCGLLAKPQPNFAWKSAILRLRKTHLRPPVMEWIRTISCALLAASLLVDFVPASSATEPIRVGIIISETGSAASLGTEEEKVTQLLPEEVSGRKVTYLVLNDGSDPERAAQNTLRLVEESKVDAVVGSSTTQTSLAVATNVSAKQVPMIALGSSEILGKPVSGQRNCIFRTPPSPSLMAKTLVKHLQSMHYQTVAFIGMTGEYADEWLTALKDLQVELVDVERYSPADPSVDGQVLKIVAKNPDATIIAGYGTPAALPQMALRLYGYKKAIYQTHGAATRDFLRVGGREVVEGTFLPASPVLVADQVQGDYRFTSAAFVQTVLRFKERYESIYGRGSVGAFGSYLYDAVLLLQAAIPAALKSAEPGTPAFRNALCDSLEHLGKVTLTNGIATLSPQDHNGLDGSTNVMLAVRGMNWMLLK